MSTTVISRRRIAEIVGTAAAYLGGAHLGFLLQTLGTNTTPVWPPSGFAFAALLLFGYRVWPGIFLGALLANVTGFVTLQTAPLEAGLAASVPIAVGNTLEGVAGLALMDRLARTRRPFERQSSAYIYLSVVPLMCFVAASTGVAAICFQGFASWDEAGLVWFTWWLGDATGVLVVTSLIIAWTRPSESDQPMRWKSESAALVFLMLFTFAVVFGIPISTQLSGLPLTFLLLPLFVWSAYRFEYRGATLALTFASFFSVAATVQGSGPFVLADQNDSLLLVQGFISITGLTTLVVATEASGRRRAAAAFRASQLALLQANKLEAVGRLAGGIAHDFNNLLQVVLGQASLLRKDDPGVAAIETAAARGSALVRQLLAYSRQQVLKPSHLDLNSLVRQTAKLLKPLLGERIELDLQTSDESLTIHADRGNIERVIMNLVINGRDAMPAGGTITVRTYSEEVARNRAKDWKTRGGLHAALSVHDTGIGMDATTLDKIFDPFFTTKESVSGTGLGLATAYGIVRQSDGIIEAQSAPGAGATFQVSFPLVEVPAEIASREIAPPTPRPGVGWNILLVEDKPDVRHSLEVTLAMNGHRVTATKDGAEAWAEFEKRPGRFDVVITDVVMPQMTGAELTRRIKDLDPGFPVLLLSGYADEIPVTASRTEFLQKPFVPKDLLIKLEELLDS